MKKVVSFLISGWVLALFAATAAAAPGFSEINNELFDKAHLKNIEQPGTLTYHYKKKSFVEDSREEKQMR